MPDILFRVKDIEKFLNTKARIEVRVESANDWEVFPCFLLYPAGIYSLNMESDGDGHVTYTATPASGGDPIENEPILSAFVFVDNTFTIKSDGEITAEAKIFDASDKETEGGIDKAAGSAMTANSIKEFPVSSNRVALQVTTHAPSQLSVDVFGDDPDVSIGEVNLAHKEGWVDVFFYPHKDGRYLPSEGIKIGYFEYAIDNPYTIAMAFSPSPEDDSAGTTVLKGIVSNGKSSVMLRPLGRFQTSSVIKVSVRESGMTTGGNGSYDIDQLGAPH